MGDSWVRLRWWYLFLCAVTFAFLSGLAVAGAEAHAETASLPENEGKIMQFESGGHILGFDAGKVYMVGLGYALIEEFVSASQVRPVARASREPAPANDARKASQIAPAFQGVAYPDLWKGVTLRYERASDGLAESVYVIKPEGDVGTIRIRYNVDFEIMDDGALRFLHPTKKGYFTMSRPVAWQEIGGKRVPVEVAFKDHGNRTLGFVVGARDPGLDMIIDPTYQWHTFYGSADYDYGYGIAVTGDGVYVTGGSSAPWQGDGGQDPIHAHSGYSDIVILKLSLAGAYQWHTFYGSASNDYGYGIAVTGDGVYVTGGSFAPWQGDGGQDPIHAHSGYADIVILKLSLAGAYQWHTFYGSADSDYGYGIAVTGDGVYVTGFSLAQWQGNGSQEPIHAHSGDADIVILKLSLGGAYQWHTFYGYTDSDYGYGIAVTGDGAYVTGISFAQWQGDGGQEPIHAHSGNDDIVILKLSLGGVYQWHTFYGSADSDYGYGIAVTGDGVYVTGFSPAPWQGNGSQDPIHAHNGYDDIVVLKLSLAGAYQWHTFYGSASNDYGYGIAVTGDGVYVTGRNFASWQGDGGQDPIHAHSGGYDTVILKLSLAGAYQWHAFYGSADYDYGYGIAVTGDGVYVTGGSSAPWQGDGGQDPIHAYSGNEDIVILKLSDMWIPKDCYVDITNGNDANDGSQSKPWKTLHHAITQINGGSAGQYTLHVGPGTYSLGNGEADAELVLTQSNVTIIGAGGSASVIEGPFLNGSAWSNGLTIEGSNCTIENLHITGFTPYWPTYGIKFNSGSNNTVVNCKVYGNMIGVVFGSTTSGNKVQSSEIYNNNDKGIECNSDNVITQNIIHDNTFHGIYVLNSSPEISRNSIYDNYHGISAHGNADATAPVAPMIKNNLLYQSAGGVDSAIFIGADSAASPVVPSIYHNTLDQGSYGVQLINQESGTLRPLIKYNIITNFSVYGIMNSGGAPDIDYNDVWNNGTNYAGCASGLYDISQDPQYGSYQLKSTSPCIDKIPPAIDPVNMDYAGCTRPMGDGKDMGAYEYVGTMEYFYPLPGGTGQVTDYRIFTVPLYLGTGANLQSAMEKALGAYDPSKWRVFAYLGGQYLEMGTPGFSSLQVKPGMGFWIITLYTTQVPFEGGMPPDGVPYELPLPPGWSLMALPWINTSINLGNIFVTDGVGTYRITDPANPLTQHCVWDYTGTGPYSGYEKRDAADDDLRCGVGYFIQVLSAASVKLIIPPNNTGEGFLSPHNLDRMPKTGGNGDEPPPPPGAAPRPDIKVNGIDGSVTAAARTPISVSVTLDPGAWAGREADWWIGVHTPLPAPHDWYTYIYSIGWQPGIHRCIKAPLFKIEAPVEVLNRPLPAGEYFFVFAVDGNADNVPDVTWYDAVGVKVGE